MNSAIQSPRYFVISLWKVKYALSSANTWAGSSWESVMKTSTLSYADADEKPGKFGVARA